MLQNIVLLHLYMDKIIQVLNQLLEVLTKKEVVLLFYLINILKPLGMSIKKASFIKNISKEITETYNGIIPDDINTLMKMDGVGRKTANLVLSTLYNKPYIAVDTHVERVCKRLNLVSKDANVLEVEQELYNIIPKDRLNKTHHQLVLFGRYYCKSIKPKCDTCKLKEICIKEKS